VVWAGPPGASPGHPAPWVEPWVVWRDERVALPRRWDAEIRHPEVPWNVILTVAVEGGRLACEHVAVSQRPGGPRVTSAALRRLPVDTLAVVAARAVTQAQDPAEDDPDVLFARMRERLAGNPRTSRNCPKRSWHGYRYVSLGTTAIHRYRPRRSR